MWDMNVEVIEKTFACAEHARLKISNIRGRVIIQGGSAENIKVRAEKVLDSGDANNTTVEISQLENGKVIVTTRYEQFGFRFFRNSIPCRVNYEIAVPPTCELNVNGVSNFAGISGISGEIQVSTVSGDLELNSLDGKIQIKSVSGDVQGREIRGAAEINTVSGDFILHDCDFPSLHAKTVSGDLLIETLLGSGPYELHAVSGDIKLEVPDLQGTSIDSSSLSGDVRTPLQFASINHTRNHHRLEIFGGGVEIGHHSVSGDFYIDSQLGEGKTADHEFDQLGESDLLSHAEILDRIQSGELSVEDALGMIESPGIN
jgi:hypothetical protein